jgi:hypothetical protein
MIILARVGLTQLAASKQSSNLSMYMTKGVGNRGKPCLTSILQLIFYDHPSVLLNLTIMVAYKCVAMMLGSEGTFIPFNLFQWLVLGTVSKVFLKSMKQQRILVLLLLNSFAMILSMTRWSTFE